MTKEEPSLLVYGIVGFAIMTVGFVMMQERLGQNQPVTLIHVLLAASILSLSFVVKRLRAGVGAQKALWAMEYAVFGALLCMTINSA